MTREEVLATVEHVAAEVSGKTIGIVPSEGVNALGERLANFFREQPEVLSAEWNPRTMAVDVTLRAVVDEFPVTVNYTPEPSLFDFVR